MDPEYARTLELTFGSDLTPIVEVVTSTPLAVCLTNEEGIFVFANKAYCELYSYQLDELLGQEFTLVVPDNMKENAREMHRNFIESGNDNPSGGDRAGRNEWTVFDRSGRSKVVVAEASRVTDKSGRVYKATFVVDVTDRKAKESWLLQSNAELAYKADHDALMSILNRRAGLEVMHKAIFVSESNRTKLSLAIIDIDHFKEVNDLYGHLVGDQVLSSFASIISDNLRRLDKLIRYGGEELLLVMPGIGAKDALKVLERLLDLVSGAALTESSIYISFSGGIAEFESGMDSALLLERADKALYSAKKHRNKIEIWTDRSDILF